MNDILKTFIYCFILSSLFSTIVLSQNPDLVASFGNLEDNENENIVLDIHINSELDLKQFNFILITSEDVGFQINEVTWGPYFENFGMELTLIPDNNQVIGYFSNDGVIPSDLNMDNEIFLQLNISYDINNI